MTRFEELSALGLNASSKATVKILWFVDSPVAGLEVWITALTFETGCRTSVQGVAEKPAPIPEMFVSTSNTDLPRVDFKRRQINSNETSLISSSESEP
jgi:hypothetical protein